MTRVFSSRVTSVFYEQYLTIVPEGLFNISLCLLPTFVVCCLLLGLDLRSGLLNLITIIMIIIDTVGVMTLWSIDYNAVALINLVTVRTHLWYWRGGPNLFFCPDMSEVVTLFSSWSWLSVKFLSGPYWVKFWAKHWKFEIKSQNKELKKSAPLTNSQKFTAAQQKSRDLERQHFKIFSSKFWNKSQS